MGDLNQREKIEATGHKAAVSPVYKSDKHLPQSLQAVLLSALSFWLKQHEGGFSGLLSSYQLVEIYN